MPNSRQHLTRNLSQIYFFLCDFPRSIIDRTSASRVMSLSVLHTVTSCSKLCQSTDNMMWKWQFHHRSVLLMIRITKESALTSCITTLNDAGISSSLGNHCHYSYDNFPCHPFIVETCDSDQNLFARASHILID